MFGQEANRLNQDNNIHDEAFDADLICPTCGYNLRGLPSDRCPECGNEFDRSELAGFSTPWQNDRHDGVIRAYWRTVWMALRRTGTFRQVAANPVTYRDAQHFRWITLAHVYLPFVIIIVALSLEFDIIDEPFRSALGQPLDGPFAIAKVLLSGAIVLILLTGIPSYLFHPKRLPVNKQNHAIALSYYGCAPLALTPLFWLMIWALERVEPGARLAGSMLALGLFMQFLGTWVFTCLLAKYSLGYSGFRTVLFGILLLTLWLVCIGLACFVLALVVNFIGIFYYNLAS